MLGGQRELIAESWDKIEIEATAGVGPERRHAEGGRPDG
jgi:hypothetical protein